MQISNGTATNDYSNQNTQLLSKLSYLSSIQSEVKGVGYDTQIALTLD